MVDACIEELCAGERIRRHDVDATHEVQTRRYIATFHEALQAWHEDRAVPFLTMVYIFTIDRRITARSDGKKDLDAGSFGSY